MNKGAAEIIKYGLEIDLATLKDQIAEANNKISKLGGDNANKGVRKLRKEIERLTEAEDKLKKKIDVVNEAMDKPGRGATKFSTRIKNMMKYIPIGITIAGTFMKIVGAMGATFKANVKLDNQMSKLNTLLHVGKNGLETYKKIFLDMSEGLGVGADELAEIGYQALSAGVKQEHMLMTVKKAAQLSKAGFTDSATAINVLTSVMNTYGGNVNDIADKLVQTQNLGKLTIDQMSGSISASLPTMNSYKISIDEVMGSIAEMTKHGMSAATAGNSLSQMVTELGKSSSTAGKYFEKISGKNLREFIDQNGTLSGALSLMKEHADADNIALGSLFTNKKSVSGVLNLTSDIDGLNESIKGIKESSGVADTAFGEATDNLTTHFKKMISSWETALGPFMDKLTDITDKVVKFLTIDESKNALVDFNAYNTNKNAKEYTDRYKHGTKEEKERLSSDYSENNTKRISESTAEQMAAFEEFKKTDLSMAMFFKDLVIEQGKSTELAKYLAKKKFTPPSSKGTNNNGGTEDGNENDNKNNNNNKGSRKIPEQQFVDPNFNSKIEEQKSYYDQVDSIKNDHDIASVERYNELEQARFDHEQAMKDLNISTIEAELEHTESLQQEYAKRANNDKSFNAKAVAEANKAEKIRQKLEKAKISEIKKADKKRLVQDITYAQAKENVEKAALNATQKGIEDMILGKNKSIKEMGAAFTKEIAQSLAKQSAMLIIDGTSHVLMGMAKNAAVPGTGAAEVATGEAEVAQGVAFGAAGALANFVGDALTGDDDSSAEEEKQKEDNKDTKDDKEKDKEEKKCEETVIMVERTNETTKVLLDELNSMAMRQTGSSIYNSKITLRK